MLARYHNTLVELAEKTQLLASDPQQHRYLYLEIQETLIDKISYVERRIRQTKARAKELRGQLKTRRDVRLTKEEARALKEAIAQLESDVDEYRLLLYIFRKFGDALAFIHISKWDIKPLGYRQSTGFITGKKGNRLERKIMRGCFDLGVAAILNDLTNCLRYGDVTVLLPGQQFHIFEAKSSKNRKLSSDDEKQVKDIEHILSYLLTDQTDQLYETTGDIRRIDHQSGDEQHHRVAMNALLQRAAEEGSSVAEIERGIYYYACTKPDYAALEHIVKQCKQPIADLINHTAYLDAAWCPLTLSITNPELLYRFLADELNILVIIDFAVIESAMADRGYEVKYISDGDWAIALSSPKIRERFEGDSVKISRHFYGRLSVEFLALDWFVRTLESMADIDPTIWEAPVPPNTK